MILSDLTAIALTMLLSAEGHFWFYFTPHPDYWEWKLDQSKN